MSSQMLQLVILFLLACCSPSSLSLSWPFSSSSPPPPPPPNHGFPLNSLKAAEFSMESANDPRGMKLVENAKQKLLSPNTCWHNAYRSLFAGCSEMVADQEKQSRLAWLLSDCFQRDSGRSPLPACDAAAPMVNCLKRLDDVEHKIYLEFFLETNSICHQLQTSAFKHDTERLVNELTKSAQFAETKLSVIDGKADQLLQGSNKIHDSLANIDLQTKELAETSKSIESNVHDVLKNSEVLFHQYKGISASQVELQRGQVNMKETLESGMNFLSESYENLGDRIEKLRMEAVEIEKEIAEVGESMTSKMTELQDKAKDIGDVAGASLEKQKRILEGQTMAIEGIDFIAKINSQALQESKDALQKLSEFSEEQQAEVLRTNAQIQQAHDHLIQSSQSILTAQKEFESKQANIFVALDKIFTLHNALLVESRLIKSFFFYVCVIFVLVVLTSTKQTFGIRARLYIGLCLTFVVELAIIRLGDDDLVYQTWIQSKIFVARSTFLIVASIQLLHAIFTYRDYEILSHQLLQTLMDKLDIMEQNSAHAAKEKLLSLNMESDDEDSNLSRYSWIDEELLEDVNSDCDPNYIIPEEVGENSITTSIARKYELRPRKRAGNYI